jgi:hypothetical protein
LGILSSSFSIMVTIFNRAKFDVFSASVVAVKETASTEGSVISKEKTPLFPTVVDPNHRYAEGADSLILAL